MEIERSTDPTPSHLPLLVNTKIEAGPTGNSFADTAENHASTVDSTDGAPKCLRMETKVCGVCGDKALGNNFNAITCESCKAFFRRNALKQKGFVCPFNDNCKVDAVTRRFCQKCRLKKCFEIGMKKEWIMSEDEKKLKKRKIEQNKIKRQGSADGPADTPPAKSLRTSCDQTTLNLTQDPSLGESPDVSTLGMILPHNGADSTTFDHSMDAQIPLVQSSDVTCSPSSNSNSSSDMCYMITPMGMSQFVGSAQAPISPASTDSQNGHDSPHLMASSFQTQTRGIEAPGMEWVNDENGQRSCSVSSSPTFILPNAVDPEPINRCDISTHQFHLGGHTTKGNAVQIEYTGQLESRQLKLKLSPPFSSNEYHTPLLSSLIRPGEPECSKPTDCSTTGSGNLRNHNSFGRFGSGQLPVTATRQNSAMDNLRHEPQFRHGYNPAKLPYKVVPGESVFSPESLPPNTMDSIEVAIRAEFNAFGMMCKPLESITKELNGAEVAKLQELLMACEALGDPVDQEGHLNLSKHSDPTLINVINLTDIAIRRLIKMSKKISAFKNMCQEDQIALLKGGCVEIMILRSVVTYDPDRDSWNIPHSYGYNIKLGVLKEARGNLYEEHQRFVKSFKPEWRQDEKIMILLCAITLFTAERPNVIHKDVVKLEQDSYYYLLKRYLESILNGCEARSTYLLLIRKIAELRILNSTHLRVFLEVNPREVEPLLREVFSMV